MGSLFLLASKESGDMETNAGFVRVTEGGGCF